MEQNKPQEAVSAKPPYPWRVPIVRALLGGPLEVWLMAFYLWFQNGWISRVDFVEVIGAAVLFLWVALINWDVSTLYSRQQMFIKCWL
ncbi:hypothetical protein [Eikenella sp. NML96-A-049]|nr:hypothetical protein [Eikenella sp. NML96-A-049]